MKKIISAAFALLLTLSLFSIVCHAEDPVEGYCFLRIDGIEGACDLAGHARWHDVVDYKVNNTVTDADGNEIPTSITFTCRVEPSLVKIYDRYTQGYWFRDAKMDITEVLAGKRTVVSTLDLGKCKITDLSFVALDDGDVAEIFTLTSDKDPDVFSQVGSTFGTGCIALVCVCAAVVIGGGAFFIIRRKKKNNK